MARDLNHFFLKHKQSSQRYNTTLDSILNKYDVTAEDELDSVIELTSFDVKTDKKGVFNKKWEFGKSKLVSANYHESSRLEASEFDNGWDKNSFCSGISTKYAGNEDEKNFEALKDISLCVAKFLDSHEDEPSDADTLSSHSSDSDGSVYSDYEDESSQKDDTGQEDQKTGGKYSFWSDDEVDGDYHSNSVHTGLYDNKHGDYHSNTVQTGLYDNIHDNYHSNKAGSTKDNVTNTQFDVESVPTRNPVHNSSNKVNGNHDNTIPDYSYNNHCRHQLTRTTDRRETKQAINRPQQYVPWDQIVFTDELDKSGTNVKELNINSEKLDFDYKMNLFSGKPISPKSSNHNQGNTNHHQAKDCDIQYHGPNRHVDSRHCQPNPSVVLEAEQQKHNFKQKQPQRVVTIHTPFESKFQKSPPQSKSGQKKTFDKHIEHLSHAKESKGRPKSTIPENLDRLYNDNGTLLKKQRDQLRVNNENKYFDSVPRKILMSRQRGHQDKNKQKEATYDQYLVESTEGEIGSRRFQNDSPRFSRQYENDREMLSLSVPKHRLQNTSSNELTPSRRIKRMENIPSSDKTNPAKQATHSKNKSNKVISHGDCYTENKVMKINTPYKKTVSIGKMFQEVKTSSNNKDDPHKYNNDKKTQEPLMISPVNQRTIRTRHKTIEYSSDSSENEFIHFRSKHYHEQTFDQSSKKDSGISTFHEENLSNDTYNERQSAEILSIKNLKTFNRSFKESFSFINVSLNQTSNEQIEQHQNDETVLHWLDNVKPVTDNDLENTLDQQFNGVINECKETNQDRKICNHKTGEILEIDNDQDALAASEMNDEDLKWLRCKHIFQNQQEIHVIGSTKSAQLSSERTILPKQRDIAKSPVRYYAPLPHCEYNKKQNSPTEMKGKSQTSNRLLTKQHEFTSTSKVYKPEIYDSHSAVDKRIIKKAHRVMSIESAFQRLKNEEVAGMMSSFVSEDNIDLTPRHLYAVTKMQTELQSEGDGISFGKRMAEDAVETDEFMDYEGYHHNKVPNGRKSRKVKHTSHGHGRLSNPHRQHNRNNQNCRMPNDVEKENVNGYMFKEHRDSLTAKREISVAEFDRNRPKVFYEDEFENCTSNPNNRYAQKEHFRHHVRQELSEQEQGYYADEDTVNYLEANQKYAERKMTSQNKNTYQLQMAKQNNLTSPKEHIATGKSKTPEHQMSNKNDVKNDQYQKQDQNQYRQKTRRQSKEYYINNDGNKYIRSNDRIYETVQGKYVQVDDGRSENENVGPTMEKYNQPSGTYYHDNYRYNVDDRDKDSRKRLEHHQRKENHHVHNLFEDMKSPVKTIREREGEKDIEIRSNNRKGDIEQFSQYVENPQTQKHGHLNSRRQSMDRNLVMVKGKYLSPSPSGTKSRTKDTHMNFQSPDVQRTKKTNQELSNKYSPSSSLAKLKLNTPKSQAMERQTALERREHRTTSTYEFNDNLQARIGVANHHAVKNQPKVKVNLNYSDSCFNNDKAHTDYDNDNSEDDIDICVDQRGFISLDKLSNSSKQLRIQTMKKQTTAKENDKHKFVPKTSSRPSGNANTKPNASDTYSVVRDIGNRDSEVDDDYPPTQRRDTRVSDSLYTHPGETIHHHDVSHSTESMTICSRETGPKIKKSLFPTESDKENNFNENTAKQFVSSKNTNQKPAQHSNEQSNSTVKLFNDFKTPIRPLPVAKKATNESNEKTKTTKTKEISNRFTNSRSEQYLRVHGNTNHIGSQRTMTPLGYMQSTPIKPGVHMVLNETISTIIGNDTELENQKDDEIILI